MTLNDILHGAQGGQAVANLGAQFGLAPAAAEAAVQAMIPAFSAALTQIAANPAAIGAAAQRTRERRARRVIFRPSQTAGAGGLGGSVLGPFSVRPQAIETIIAHVAEVSGVSRRHVPLDAARGRFDADRRTCAFDGQSGAFRRSRPTGGRNSCAGRPWSALCRRRVRAASSAR